MTTQTFTFTGADQSFVVPANVSKLTVECWGAQGGRSVPYFSNHGSGADGGCAVGWPQLVPCKRLASGGFDVKRPLPVVGLCRP